MNARNRIPVCPHEDRKNIDLHLCILWEKMLSICEVELVLTSGLRCPECNKAANGAENSAHLVGKALDILCLDSLARFDIITTAAMLGVRRMGIGKDHIHIDIDETKDQEVAWMED